MNKPYTLSGSGSASALRYTWLLVTYRRKPLFAGSAQGVVETVLREVAVEAGVDVEAVDVAERRAVVVGKAPAEASPAGVAHVLQRASAPRIRERVPSLADRRSVWTRRFLVTTRELNPDAVAWFVGLQPTS